MKTHEIHAIVTKNHENLRMRHENHETYDNPIISCEKHESTENHENHQNP